MDFFKLAITAIAFTVASAGIQTYFAGQRQEDFEKKADEARRLERALATAQNEESARVARVRTRHAKAERNQRLAYLQGTAESGRQKIGNVSLTTGLTSALNYLSTTASLKDQIGEARTELAKLQSAGPGFGESIATAGLGLASSLSMTGAVESWEAAPATGQGGSLYEMKKMVGLG